MKSAHLITAVILAGCLTASQDASAVIDPAASVVQLRVSCGEGGGTE